MSTKKTCIVASPFTTRSGYGDHSRDIIRSLIELKGSEWDIQLLSLPWGNCPMNALEYTQDKDLIDKMIVDQQKITVPDIWIQITIPSEFTPHGKFLNIGITAGIETTSYHPDWIQGSNKMDVVIVPSEHSKNVLKNTIYEYEDKNTGKKGELKFEKNVEVLFEGVDTSVFHKISEINKTIDDSLREVKEKFAFLFVGHWMEGFIGQDRKDVGGMVHSFIEAFKNKKDKPALILKTSGANFSEIDLYRIQDKLDLLTKDSNVPIYLIHGDLSPEEMNSLYNHSKIKAMISFTKGEGFGRPLLEFASIGKPVIASNWSGQVDFLSPQFSVLIGGELQDVHESAFNKDYMGEGSKWFQVDYTEAKKVLKDVHKNYDHYLKKAYKGLDYYSKFSLSDMTEEFGRLLDKYQLPEQLSSDDVILPE